MNDMDNMVGCSFSLISHFIQITYDVFIFQCMSPSRLQFIYDEIRCLNQSVSELSFEKEKLTESILKELSK